MVSRSGYYGNLSLGYRYGFNGKENDNEVKGQGNSIDYGERMYDPRLGRWLSVDMAAKSAPGWTPYRFGFDNPMRYKDPSGGWEEDGHFWTVYAMGIAMGMKQSSARELAVRSEYYDHIVHGNNSMSIHPHKSGFSWGSDGGLGTWAEGDKQKSWHALTGGLHADIMNAAITNIMRGDLNQLHTLGDSYAHSYVGNDKQRKMWGGGHLAFGITWEHKFFGGYGNENADDISKRPLEYWLYTKSLYQLFNDKNFSYNKYVTNPNPSLAIFDYVQQNGGSKTANIFLLQSYIGLNTGVTNFTSSDPSLIGKLKGYLDQQGIKYTTSTTTQEVSTGTSPTTGVSTSTTITNYNLTIIPEKKKE
jgi:RHS repeat-associated protein